jgi:hypothetical protein
MRRRTWIVGGAVVAAIAFLVVGPLDEAKRDAVTARHGGAVRGLSRTQLKTQPPTPRRSPPQLVPTTADAGASSSGHDARKIDIEKVEAEFARFNAVASRITQEQLDAEQARMREAQEELSAVAAPDPTAREIKDEHGFRWIELTYPSGEIRYELPPWSRYR